MSSEFQVQLEAHPQRKTATRVFSFVSTLALICIIGWLVYEVYQLKNRIETIESGTAGIQSELAVVGMLARNADMHAHTHTYSDVRLKRGIADLDSSVDNILLLHGVSFEWRVDDFPDMSLPNGSQLGFIAQEVEKVYPELVSVDADGYKHIDYAGLTPVLVEAIKDQQTTIDSQKALIADLQQDFSLLDSRLTLVENSAGIRCGP